MANSPNKIKRPWQPERKAFERPIDFSWFYNDRKWRKVSKLFRQLHPFCQCEDCQLNDIVLPAQVCDHIKGLKYLLDNKIDPYDFKELQSMSKKCHDKKSGKGYGVKSR